MKCQCITSMARYRCRHSYGLSACALEDLFNQQNTITAMSTYTEISKRIGYRGSAQWPDIQAAKDLKTLAENGDEKAFETLFKINRFAPSPSTDEQHQSCTIVCGAFIKASKLFKP